MSFCPLDVIIAVDLSGSTHPPHHDCSTHPNPTQWPAPHAGQSYKGGAIYEAELKLLEGIINFLKPGMAAGQVQVGVAFWGGLDTNNLNMDYNILRTPQLHSMTNDYSSGSILDTIPSIQDPNYSQYVISPLANHMRQAGAANWNTTHVPMAILSSLPLLDSTFSQVPGHPNYFGTYNTVLGDRSPNGSNAPDFKSVLVVITDSQSPPHQSGFSQYWGSTGLATGPNAPLYWPIPNPPSGNSQLVQLLIDRTENGAVGCWGNSSSLTPNPFVTGGLPTSVGQGHSWQYIFGCVARPGPFSGAGGQTTPIQNNIVETLNAITCNQNANYSIGGGAQGFYVDATDPNSISNVANEIANLTCTAGNESFDCNNTGQVISLTSGVIVQPWDCYDPGTGLGQYSVANGHPLPAAACDANCNAPPESWNCRLPLGTAIGICTDPGNGLGQYSVANGYSNPYQDCIDDCKDLPYIPPDRGLTGDICEICCCKPYQTGPGLPWVCIPGTQIMSAANLNPCDCATLNMIDCTEDVGTPLYGYNCDASNGQCIGPVANGTYTAANAALSLNPATPGINYPNTLAGALTYCEDSCLPILGTSCDSIRSCPCGWAYDQTTGKCESPGLTQTMIIDAIENCITLQPPPHQPVVGDIWANLSPNNIPPPYTWNAVEVVEIGGQIQGTSSIEVRSQC